MFVTPVEYTNMVNFVRTRCAPWADFFGETRGSTKRLVPTEPIEEGREPSNRGAENA
jgi:hypothetical protein